MYLGLALASLYVLSLATLRGLPVLVTAALIGSVLAVFFGSTLAAKVVTGSERVVFYRQSLGAIAGGLGLLWLLHQSALPYLDLIVLGVGLCLACCRVGCLMVGCCHGRPAPWGVCYRSEHALSGFPAYYVGVRLFPIQAVEAVWAFGVVAVGTTLILSGSSPGTGLTWFVITYAPARFAIELVRGNPLRRYLYGFSEAQWTSVLLTFGVVGAEAVGILPNQPWHAGVTAFFIAALAVISLSRRIRKTPRHRLLHPDHVQEVAEALGLGAWPPIAVRHGSRPALGPAEVPTSTTSLGIRVSANTIENGSERTYHVAISGLKEPLTEETARVLAELIGQLTPSQGAAQLLRGHTGVYHVLVPGGRAESRVR
jgi:hypothetical protein